MVQQTYVEKRVFERIPSSMEGEYACADNSSGKAVCRDISASGVRINATKPLFINNRLKISFLTKKMLPFCVEGKVRWCKRFAESWQAGVAFEKPYFFPVETVI